MKRERPGGSFTTPLFSRAQELLMNSPLNCNTPTVLVSLVLGFFAYKILLKPKTPVTYPPGPRGWPVVGNMFDLPPATSKRWIALAEMGDKYGDIVHLKILGRHLVVLNSFAVASALLDTRGLVYSDRPVLTMAGKLVGFDQTPVLTQYGPTHRKMRKLYHRHLATKEAEKSWEDMLERTAMTLVLAVEKTPEHWKLHVDRATSSLLLLISHGYTLEPGPDVDPIVHLSHQVTTIAARTGIPGSFLVDLIPSMQYLPSWLPGAGFKRKAKDWRKVLEETANRPLEFVKAQLAAGTAMPSFTSALLEDKEEGEVDEDMIKWMAGSLFSGGYENMAATLEALILALIVYPQVQSTAITEIDAFLSGSDHAGDKLIRVEDRSHLPYLDALCKEAFRWHPVTPTGIAHKSNKDDVYEGMFIPKNAYMIPNIWKMTHDPTVYHDPMSFQPQRFLGERNEQDPLDLCFGFGRRRCPGVAIANSTMFILISSLLSAFTFHKEIMVDKMTGKEMELEPVVDQTAGITSRVVPFRCRVLVRREGEARLAALRGE